MSAEPAALPLHRLDLATYTRLVASGALDGQPVELLEGLLVDMSAHGPEHARAQVPTYWLVDVPGSRVVVHTDPVGGQYRDRAERLVGDLLASPAEGVDELSVADLFAGLAGG